MSSGFVWRIGLVAFVLGIAAGAVTVAVRSHPAASVAFVEYNIA